MELLPVFFPNLEKRGKIEKGLTTDGRGCFVVFLLSLNRPLTGAFVQIGSLAQRSQFDVWTGESRMLFPCCFGKQAAFFAFFR